MNASRCAILAALSILTGSAAGKSDEEPPRVTFPVNYASWVLYNVIDREDQREVHEQYTSREALDAATAGKPLPYGTIVVSANHKAQLDIQGRPRRDSKGSFIAGDLDRITVMEKRPGWGAEYPDELRNGEWEFAAFTPDGRRNAQVPAQTCMACHKPHAHLDYIKTYFAMGGRRVEDSPAPVPAGASVTTVVRFSVRPARVTVQAGTPVSWINADEVAHQFAIHGTAVTTAYFLKGGTGTIVLREPGIYSYEDTFYPNVEALKGVIEVRK